MENQMIDTVVTSAAGVFTGNTYYPEFPLSQLRPNPEQPRKWFDPKEQEALVASIKRMGVIQPIIAMLDESKETAMIMAGERRYRAATDAGLTGVPVITKDADPVETAIIENMQRSNFTIVEESEAVLDLKEKYKYKGKEIAILANRAESTISEILSINDLPAVVKDEIRGLKTYTRAELLMITSKYKQDDDMISAFNKLKAAKIKKEDEKAAGTAKKNGKGKKATDATTETVTADATTAFQTLTDTYITELTEFDLTKLDETQSNKLLESLKNLNKLIASKIKKS